MSPITYRVPALATTPLLAIVLALFVTLLPRPGHAEGLALKFITEGTILPRRGHEVLTVESVDIARLEASILHVSEADTLAALAHPDGPIPAGAETVWHAEIEVKTDNKPPLPGQPVKTTLDVLQLVKSLQPGLYIAELHEVTTGKPRAVATKQFMISNIGLEAFAGSDGLAVQARLLSEASPAVNIDIALIARNNREIARLRTDGDAVARFSKDQIAGVGDDAPAALYAYGADGEFTAMPLSIAAPQPTPPASAIVMTDKQTYMPGESIRGLVLARSGDSSPLAGQQLFAQLENESGGIAQFAVLKGNGGSGFGIDFQSPPAAFAGKWFIRVYLDKAGKPVLIGQTPVAVSTGKDAGGATSNPTPEIVGDIKISPGRRSFQAGQMADVSVQPAHDAYVTIALVDSAVRALVRQKISKDGAPIQLPVPADASGGLYVVATAYTPPVLANGTTPAQPLHRSFGIQWLDIDEGTSRMSVRLDTPERAEIGGKLPVAVTLPDLGGKTGNIQLIATDASQPAMLDPLAYFYGRKPLQVHISDNYASVIGATDAPVPDFATSVMPPPTAPALLWPEAQETSKTGKADFVQIFPAMTSTDPRLRISAIAWSNDKLGYGEATVIGVKPAKPVKVASKSKPTLSSPHIRATIIKPGETLSLKPHEAIVSNVDPIVALPISYNEAGGDPDGDDSLFIDGTTPALHDLMLSLLSPQSDDVTLKNALLAQNVGLPQSTITKLLDVVQGIANSKETSADNRMVAYYILLKSGRSNNLEVQDWLKSNTKFDGLLAKTARLALSDQIKLSHENDSGLESEIDQPQDIDLETRAFVLMLFSGDGQLWPPQLAKITSDEALKTKQSLSFRTDLALRFAQSQHRDFDVRLQIGKDGILPEAQNNTSGPLKVTNNDTRPIYAWIVSGLPPSGLPK